MPAQPNGAALSQLAGTTEPASSPLGECSVYAISDVGGMGPLVITKVVSSRREKSASDPKKIECLNVRKWNLHDFLRGNKRLIICVLYIDYT
ncbi:MAG: hypothetical protein QG606_289 [Patescibacteria group bacterium]|jgi:hypothetical protein|nr:hypothetical protein [Patescibacteria group bacterium]